MRKFKCFDCQNAWQLPHGKGGQGTELTCPKCGSRNVHRIEKERGGGSRRRVRSQSANE
jgi:DNA-directed RNA polymerase subunit RPC12/RpoP